MKRILPKQTIVLVGCGGHSRSIADIIHHTDPSISLIFLDKNAKENPTTKYPYIIAIGDNQKRKFLYETYGQKNLISILSSLAYISKNAIVGKGSSIGNFCHVGPNAIIGDNTIVNTGAIIEHDTIIGNHCHITPGATISGRTIIGDLVFVGAGATIIDGLFVCSNVIIGAGTTVIKNITQPGTYVGTPAQNIL